MLTSWPAQRVAAPFRVPLIVGGLLALFPLQAVAQDESIPALQFLLAAALLDGCGAQMSLWRRRLHRNHHHCQAALICAKG